MKNTEFVAALKSIATKHNTLYVMGCFGAPLVTKPFNNIERYTTNHQYNRNAGRTAMIKKVADRPKTYYGFDCSGLIKAVMWGWSGDVKHRYGDASYASNGVPDLSADSMISRCSDVSTNFTNVEVGELLWRLGHVGIYIGDGLAIECTPQWSNCVQITAVKNIGTKNGYNARTWAKHGRLPFIQYVSAASPLDAIAKEVIRGKWGTGAERKKRLVAAGYNYREVQNRVNELLR